MSGPEVAPAPVKNITGMSTVCEGDPCSYLHDGSMISMSISWLWEVQCGFTGECPCVEEIHTKVVEAMQYHCALNLKCISKKRNVCVHICKKTQRWEGEGKRERKRERQWIIMQMCEKERENVVVYYRAKNAKSLQNTWMKNKILRRKLNFRSPDQ